MRVQEAQGIISLGPICGQNDYLQLRLCTGKYDADEIRLQLVILCIAIRAKIRTGFLLPPCVETAALQYDL